MNDNVAAIRSKLYDFIKVADERKIKAIYTLLEHDIEATSEWWKDENIVKELEVRYAAMESGEDEGISLDKLSERVAMLRNEKYGRKD